MKDFQRYALLAGIFIVLFLLLLQWKDFDAARHVQEINKQQTLITTKPESITEPKETSQNTSQSMFDEIPETEKASIAIKQKQQPINRLVEIKTDVLDLKIDLLGGDIVMASLPTYWASINTPDIPFELLNRTSDKLYIAQSGLIGKNGTDRTNERPVFNSIKNLYELDLNDNSLVVNLNLPSKNGVDITKQFIFKRGEYVFEVKYLINNNSTQPWEAAFFGQIKRDDHEPETKQSTGLKPFLGAAVTTNEKRYQKMKFNEIEKDPLKETKRGGWIAFVQHYFISAWIGNNEQENTYRTKKLKGEDIYVIGYTGPNQVIPQQSSGEIGGRFYAGPKITQRLEEISPFLDLTVDYGWLWWVAKPIHWVLQAVHSIVKNWGWSIIFLTLFIKLILFPLSNKAYVSMGHMRKVAPKMQQIKEQCGDNRQKLQEEMMKLYRTEKINPLGGCLPMLLQMPVFISLYWVLMESVELRHSPFVGWIKDLSVMDPYFCLPILMGISMFFQQKMNPAPPDPMQAKVMQWLPVIFTFMFLWFPAGLVLYWLVNNLVSMAHQAYINKKVENGTL